MVICTVEVNEKSPQTIVIGRRGTYNTQEVVFDIGYLIDAYGVGTAVLAVKRSQDSSAHPAVVAQEDSTVTWTVSETDTYYKGAGECELMWYVDGGLAKTIIYPMVVMRDILSTTEEAPDAYQTWVDDLTALGAETLENAQNAAQSASDAESAKDDAVTAKEAAEEAAETAQEAVVHAPIIQNGYWHIWNDGQYVDTGVRAEGQKGDKGDTGEKGDTGNGISKIEKTGTSGLVDTYTVTYTDGTSTTFTVTNGAKGDKGDTGATGNGIASITKTGTSGNVDTYTITYTNGQTTTFTVTNGAVSSVAGKTGAVTLDANDVAFSESGTYDDGTVGKELSNQKNAIDALDDTKAPVIINTVSGDIATFADGADGMPIKHLIANIEAVQSGTGDPSPTNVRPITGWTGLTGARTGENILDNTGIEVTANNLRIARNTEYGDPFLLKGGVTYTFYSNSPTRPDAIYLLVPYTSEAVYYNQGSAFFTVTPTEDAEFGINFYWINGRPSEATALYCVVGDAIGSYDPYKGQTISVSWATEAGTVYGGTLDVVTGELTVDRALVTINGTNYPVGTASSAASETALVQVIVSDIALVNEYDSGKVISDYLPSTTDYLIYRNASPAVAIHYATSESNRRLWLRLPNITTEADAKTYLANNPLTVVYPLATPIVYQLDPITVSTLLGNNTVYVDCGSVTVDYPADTGIVVTEQSNAISQLESEVVTDVTVTGTDVTIVAQANKRYLCGTVSTIAVTPCVTGAFDLIFTSGSSAAILTIPSTVKWQDSSFDPTALDTDTIYEISVADGTLGLVAKWT